MSGPQDPVDNAMQRLVVAMMGQDDPVATSLGQRVVKSQIGTAPEDEYAIELSSTWRRLSRKAPDANCRADMEQLYGTLERYCEDQPHLPPRILTVLTKLMGKKLVLPETTVGATSREKTPARAPPAAYTPSQRASSTPAQPARSSAGRNTAPMPPSSAYQQQPETSRTAATPSHPAPSVTTTSGRPSSHALRPRQPQAAAPQDRNAYDRQVGEEKRELEKEEALLLRECLYSLQGIDGERIRYYHKDGENRDDATVENALIYYDGIRIQSPALSNSLLYTGRVLETRLGTGAVDALRICGEAGWLYHRIQSYIHQVQQDESMGIVARAVTGTLGDELREYHSLLTQYESQLGNLSLRQLLVDLRMPTSRLQVLALLTDGLRHLSGGHLLSGLYLHALHGDSRHSKLAQSILCAASRPWFDILYTWTTQGVLSDPHGEFFVTESKTVEDKHLWNDKYSINKDQIPEGILDKGLVGPAFNVGKGINFIRRCLLDSKWTMHLEQTTIEEDDTISSHGGGTFQQDLGYSYHPQQDGNVALQRTLSRAANLVHTHILRTLREENHMIQHLFALKQFLLLGQGDFFSALMDGLHAEFREQPSIVGIYKHSLLSIVESALRSTNAKYMPQYVLDRLQVELIMDPDDAVYGMFGPDPRQGNGDTRTVWDIFMLDYQVPDPLRAILHPKQLDKYKMVFSLLFCLKRVEFLLNFTWRQSATLQHALQTYGHYNGIQVGNSSAFAQAFALLRTISILRQNMMHLIVNLKSYFMFEVLEGGWRKLQVDIDAAKTLDEVIAAHDSYLDGIMRKSLLRTSDNDDTIQQQLADHLQILLQISGQFCDIQERLFHESLTLADVATQKRIEADRRANQGRWGFDSEQDITEEENFFGLADQKKLKEVTRLSTSYNQNVLALLRLLNERVNGDPDDVEKDTTDIDELAEYGLVPRPNQRMIAVDDLDSQRFLIAQLDHNNYYGAQGYLR